MSDVLTWSTEQCEAWLEQDEESRFRDLREAQQAAFSIKPGLFNRRAWTEAAMRFTRFALLELRADARDTADACVKAVRVGNASTGFLTWLEREGGPDHIGDVIGIAFTRLEEAFEQHDWTGSGVTSPEQATRLLFVSNRVRELVRRSLQERGLDESFVPALKGLVDSQTSIAFRTPPNTPMPNS